MSLKEALEGSTVVQEMRREDQQKREAVETARKERNASLSPHQRWWQNFRMTVTVFEIPIFIKVQCDKWTEGLDFIRARNLNKVTTRCKTREEAAEQLRARILSWQGENVLTGDSEPPAGALLYWRIYG